MAKEELLDYIKSTGYKYSTVGAITVSVSDVKVPEEKKTIIEEAYKQVDNITKQYTNFRKRKEVKQSISTSFT